MLWLPKGKELSQHGGLVDAVGERAAEECNQFLTIAGDGTIAMWDIRIEGSEVQGAFKRKLLALRRSTQTPGARNSRRRKSEQAGAGNMDATVWGPSIIVRVQRPAASLGGAGQSVGLCSLEFSGVHPASRFYVTTEEGDLIYAMWSRDAEGSGGSGASNEEQSALALTGSGSAANHQAVQVGLTVDASVLWVAADHFRPALALQRSKFLPNCILSVGKSSFNLWCVAATDRSLRSSFAGRRGARVASAPVAWWFGRHRVGSSGPVLANRWTYFWPNVGPILDQLVLLAYTPSPDAFQMLTRALSLSLSLSLHVYPPPTPGTRASTNRSSPPRSRRFPSPPDAGVRRAPVLSSFPNRTAASTCGSSPSRRISQRRR